MIRGIYASATGMVAETARTDTIANNIANANTAGYKRDVAVNKDFASMLIWRINDGESNPSVGSLVGTQVDEIATDHAQAGMRLTGDPYNLALQGSGYFTIQTENGPRYTRDGTFTLNAQGQLVTMTGRLVLGEGGPIHIDPRTPSNKVTIDPTGRVLADQKEVGKLQLVAFADEKQLVKQGDNLFNADNAVGGAQNFTGRVAQGYLEESNSNMVLNMVNLIATYRAYELNAKVIQSHDSLLGRAVNDVGKV